MNCAGHIVALVQDFAGELRDFPVLIEGVRVFLDIGPSECIYLGVTARDIDLDDDLTSFGFRNWYIVDGDLWAFVDLVRN